jgi:multidrug resistance efflux pump
VKNGNYINKGDIIAKLENNDLVLSSKTASLNLETLHNQLKQVEDNLKDYEVVAPISRNDNISKSTCGRYDINRHKTYYYL